MAGQIIVHLYGGLADAAGCRKLTLPHQDFQSVRDVLRLIWTHYLSVSSLFPGGWEDHWPEYLLATVNGQEVDAAFLLNPGDQLLLFPAPSGG